MPRTAVSEPIDPTSELNADAYTPEQLEAYFEPNTNVYKIDNEGKERLNQSSCAYDYLASLAGPYILFAERGVGKTHLLNLLGAQIQKQGGIFIAINPEDPGSPLRALSALENRFPTAGSELLYKHILLNVLEQTLSPVTHGFRTFENSIAEAVNSWNIKISVQFANSNVDVEQNKERIENSKRDFLEKETGKTQARVEKLLQKLSQAKLKNDPNSILTRQLPVTRSIYIVIDKLDQAENQPYDNNKGNIYQQKILETLVSLVEAVKYLNSESRKNKFPLKIILSLRAITYFHTVEPNLVNKSQMDTMIFHLTWHKDAIEHLLAKRILFPNTIRAGQTWGDVLASRLPETIHYMGRAFSAIDFLSELPENRPRRAMLIWQKAVKATHSDMLIKPFDVKLTEEEFFTGYTDYVSEDLVSEISKEHELDYPKIELFFQYWSTKKDHVERITKQEKIQDIIGEFLESQTAQDLKQEIDWLNKSKHEILQILYRIGVIGVLRTHQENIKIWPISDQVYFVESKHDIQVKDYPFVIIRPILWTPLTNMEPDTTQKRKYLATAYQVLHNHLQYVDSQIESLSSDNLSRDPQAFEYVFACFFVLGQRIREFIEYPEPSDWAKWSCVFERINACWDAFAESVLTTTSADPIYNISIVSEYAAVAQPYIFRDSQDSADRFSLNPKDVFLGSPKSQKYHELFERIRRYPVQKQYSTATALRLFRRRLSDGKDSLNDALQ